MMHHPHLNQRRLSKIREDFEVEDKQSVLIDVDLEECNDVNSQPLMYRTTIIFA